MSIEEKLETIFKESFQVKRVSKEMATLRQAKDKLCLDIRYTLMRNAQLSTLVTILPSALKTAPQLQGLRKIQFKIILKKDYPSQSPKLYFTFEEAVELKLSPFEDYLTSVFDDWAVKNTLLDVIKAVPAFLIRIIEKVVAPAGVPALREYFEADRIVSYGLCQSFPLKLIKPPRPLTTALLVLENSSRVILLEESSIQGNFLTCDFINISEIIGIGKHRTYQGKILMEVRRGKSKYGIQMVSQEYQNVINCIGIAIHEYKQKQNFKEDDNSSESSQDKNLMQQQPPVTLQTIQDIQQQLVIIESIVDNAVNSENLAIYVDLLKKAVEYYSAEGSENYTLYLKKLQAVMGNETMQALISSKQEEKSGKGKKSKQYHSICQNFD